MLVSMQDGGVAYNQSFSFELRHGVDASVLERALTSVVDRHESLRTAFRMGPEGIVQMIAPSAADCNFKLEVVSSPEADAEPAALAAQHEQQALKPFDLAKAPLMSATLFQVTSAVLLLMRNVNVLPRGIDQSIPLDVTALVSPKGVKQTHTHFDAMTCQE